MTDLEQLSSVLHSEAAAVAVPPHAWEVNVRRVRRARRRKGVLASVMVVGTVVAGAAAFDLARADGGPTQRIAAGDEPTPSQDVEFLAEPVPVGQVTVADEQRTVVAYLTRGRPDEVWLCTAVADLDGQVTQKSLATTCGGTNQVDRDFLLEASPLDQSGLPIPDCRFGPMGNVVLALTGRRITSAVVGVSSGQRIRMEPVPSSEAWPYGLFRGEVPPRRFVVGYELAVGSRQVGDRLPDRAAVPAAGCPALGG